MDDHDLASFLRARRDVLCPQDVGLPLGGDRRVAGLRREEVALLAGVSTDYYTRLEQGRERRPSEQVLAAIARALQLGEAATAHLFRLVQPAPPGLALAAQEVSSALRHLVDSLPEAPAFVVGPATDVLAANPLATALYSGFAAMDNLARMVFLDPAARSFYVDWDRAARTAVANLRALSAPFSGEPRVAEVVGQLSVRSPAFATLWARYEVRPRTSDDKHFAHPQVGELHLHFEALSITSAPGQQLFVYSAAPGSPSADALVLLRQMTAPSALDTHST